MSTRIPSVLLCGYERGGTTLLSELLRNNGYEAGFECGVLICDNPVAFKKFEPYNSLLNTWWGLRDNVLHIDKNTTFEEFYDQLISKSSIKLPPDVRLFDKTPVYMRNLSKCLRNGPFIEKSIVITRDPRFVFVSWAKRAVSINDVEDYIIDNLNNLSARYLDYYLGSISHIFNPKVLFVSFEELCRRPFYILRYLSLFLNNSFESVKVKARYENVQGQIISYDKSNKISETLSDETQNKILFQCEKAAIFFDHDIFSENYKKDSILIMEEIKDILNLHAIKPYNVLIDDNNIIDPYSYLNRYDDLRRSRVNPIKHYMRNGVKEGRKLF